MKQDSIAGPYLAAVYHDYFKGHKFAAGESDNPLSDEATAAELDLIRRGEEPLPHGSRCIFDIDSMPENVEQTAFWPTWHYVARDEDGNIVNEADLSNENPAKDGFVGIQSPDSPDSVWTKSSGYRSITEVDGQDVVTSLEVSARCGSFISGTLLIPRVSRR